MAVRHPYQQKHYRLHRIGILAKRKSSRRLFPEKELWKRARDRAKRRGVPFDITVEDIVIPALCPYLGVTLEIGEGVQSDNSISLDRICPNKGYVKGNIEVISLKANRMKNNADFETLVKFAEAVLKRRDA